MLHFMVLQLSLVLQPESMCMQRFASFQGRGAMSIMEHDSADWEMAILNRPSGMPVKLAKLGGPALIAKWKELKFAQRNELKHATGSNGDEEEAQRLISEIIGVGK
jgi:hypothetical protein